MDRAAYNQCMVPYMKGAASQEERHARMCIGAKICTGKAKDEKEAAHLCAQTVRERKATGVKTRRGGKCKIDPDVLASCIIASLDGGQLNQPKLVTLVKIDKDARYFKMVDVIDEIQIVERQIKETRPDFSYRFSLSPFSEYDRRQMAEVRGGASP